MQIRQEEATLSLPFLSSPPIISQEWAGENATTKDDDDEGKKSKQWSFEGNDGGRTQKLRSVVLSLDGHSATEDTTQIVACGLSNEHFWVGSFIALSLPLSFHGSLHFLCRLSLGEGRNIFSLSPSSPFVSRCGPFFSFNSFVVYDDELGCAQSQSLKRSWKEGRNIFCEGMREKEEEGEIIRGPKMASDEQIEWEGKERGGGGGGRWAQARPSFFPSSERARDFLISPLWPLLPPFFPSGINIFMAKRRRRKSYLAQREREWRWIIGVHQSFRTNMNGRNQTRRKIPSHWSSTGRIQERKFFLCGSIFFFLAPIFSLVSSIVNCVSLFSPFSLPADLTLMGIGGRRRPMVVRTNGWNWRRNLRQRPRGSKERGGEIISLPSLSLPSFYSRSVILSFLPPEKEGVA